MQKKEKSSPDSSGEKAMTTKRSSEVEVHSATTARNMDIHQKNCTKCINAEEEKAKRGGKSPKGKKVGLVTRHVLGVREPAHDWIVDSGATCHIYNSKELFEDFHPLSEHQKVALGDGHTLVAIGTGAVEVKLEIPGGESNIGRLNESLHAYPGLQSTDRGKSH